MDYEPGDYLLIVESIHNYGTGNPSWTSHEIIAVSGNADFWEDPDNLPKIQADQDYLIVEVKETGKGN